MKNKKISICLLILAIINFSIIVPRYKSIPFQENIYGKKAGMYDLKKNKSLFFTHKVLTKNDCKKYFNSKKFLKKGYQPVYIKFTNNSEYNITLSISNFSFPCACFQDVANQLHRDGMARGVGFGFGALWFLPLLFPAFIQGLGANRYNIDMDIDFQAKALKNQIVPAYTAVEGVIFVYRHEWTKNFSLTVHTVDQKNSFTLFSIL